MLTTKAPTGCILTYSGKFVNPLDVEPEDIEIIDIAHALSNLCRYNGHVEQFYSVAQHSVLVARGFTRGSELRKWGLLHDASEAYLGDVVAPLKYSGNYDFYLEAEEELMKVIAEKFGLSWPMPIEVDEADKELRGPEMKSLKNYMPEYLNGNSPVIKGWLPSSSRSSFLYEALQLGIDFDYGEIGLT